MWFACWLVGWGWGLNSGSHTCQAKAPPFIDNLNTYYVVGMGNRTTSGNTIREQKQGVSLYGASCVKDEVAYSASHTTEGKVVAMLRCAMVKQIIKTCALTESPPRTERGRRAEELAKRRRQERTCRQGGTACGRDVS